MLSTKKEMTMRSLLIAALLLSLAACGNGSEGRPCSVADGECSQHSTPVPPHQDTK